MNLCTNTYRRGRLALAVLVLCAGMLFSSSSYAEQWLLGETRRVSEDYIVDGQHYPVIKGTYRMLLRTAVFTSTEQPHSSTPTASLLKTHTSTTLT